MSAPRVKVGGAAATFTVTDCGVVVPPGPVQVRVYFLLAVRFPVFSVPLAFFAPVQSSLAVQESALVVDQVRSVAAL